jgi:hypothetical protein
MGITEFAGAGHLLKRLVGRADQTEIDLAKRTATQALYVMIFENAEQLGLQG